MLYVLIRLLLDGLMSRCLVSTPEVANVDGCGWKFVE